MPASTTLHNSMATLTLSHLNKTFPDGTVAVRDLTLDVADGELVVLVGSSGCGKTTVLRMIAGLESPSAGRVAIGGRLVNDVHPKDRDIAMVFQNYALYPHMTVYNNMAFALQMRKLPKAEIERRVREAAALLGIDALLHRKPRALSGGQRQRVAVGRAIVREPKCFLFDEPLSNLDARLRVSTRAEIKALHQRLRTTTVYVTHDQEEAMTLGDRVVVMADGAIQQDATPLEVYRTPANRFVAGFVGTPAMNFYEGRLQCQDHGNTDAGVVFTPDGARDETPIQVTLPSDALHHDHRPEPQDIGAIPAVLGLRPTNFRVIAPERARPDDLRLRVHFREPLGEQIDLRGHALGLGPLIARVAVHELVSDPASEPAGLLPEINSEVVLRIDPDKAHLFASGPMGINLATAQRTLQPAPSAYGADRDPHPSTITNATHA